MLNPSPRSPFSSAMTTGSLLHMARPDNGSSDRDFNLLREFSRATLLVTDNACSDLALTSRSMADRAIGWVDAAAGVWKNVSEGGS